MATDTLLPPHLAEFRSKARAWLEEVATAHGWLRKPGSARRRVAVGDDEAVARNRECQRILFEAGFAGLSWPTAYGGQGLGIAEQLIFNREALAYDLPLEIYIIGLGMCGPTILAVGGEQQKARYIRPMLEGREVWSQLFSEPDAGSDVASLTTRAVRDGEGWVLRGQKVWTSGAHYSDFGIVLARTDPALPRHKGLTMFILDLHAPGVSMRPIRQIDGGAYFNEVFLDDVRVSDAEVLGGLNGGWKAATTTLMNERVSLGAVRPLDDCPSAEDLAALARSTGQADDPGVRRELASLWAEEQVVGLFGERVTGAVLAGQTPGPEGSVAKLVRTALTDRAARITADLTGPRTAAWGPEDPGAGVAASTLLFVPSLSIAGGTDEILRNIIGERVLGLPKEPPVSHTPDSDVGKGARA